MADMGAIERAAGAPGGQSPMTPPGPESAPPGGGGVETLVENLSAVGEFLKAQGENPAAGEAMQHLQSLIQSLMALSGGGEAPAGPAPVGGTGTGRLPENSNGSPKIM